MALAQVERRRSVRGIRGGNWNNDSSNLRVSDRNNAGNTNANRNNNNGVRLCKTSPISSVAEV